MRGISWLAERTLSFLRRTLLHGVSYEIWEGLLSLGTTASYEPKLRAPDDESDDEWVWNIGGLICKENQSRESEKICHRVTVSYFTWIASNWTRTTVVRNRLLTAWKDDWIYWGICMRGMRKQESPQSRSVSSSPGTYRIRCRDANH
jgi:hypothetical protein